MVGRSRKAGFLRNEDGIALTEGLIVFPLMILAIAACVEFGFVLNQWTLASKAMQLGVRKLVVWDPAAANFKTDFAAYYADGGGLITPSAGVKSVCDPGTDLSSCDKTILDRLVILNKSSDTQWHGLQAFFPNLKEEDIKITYELSGLGYYGRPGGPVVTVRMEMDRGAIDLPVLGVLLDIAGITFPPFTVTATSEDLKG